MHKRLLAIPLTLFAIPALAADPLPIGTSVQGRLAATDRSNDNGGRSHDYTLRLSEGQLIAITAKSDDFDTMVIVFKPDGDKLGENDDREGGGTDSLLVVSAPESGDYTVRLNSLAVGEGHVGAYTLRASAIDGD